MLKTRFETLENELKKKSLYDAVSERADTIVEAAAMLPRKNYDEIMRAVSEIMVMVSKKGA